MGITQTSFPLTTAAFDNSLSHSKKGTNKRIELKTTPKQQIKQKDEKKTNLVE